MLDILCFAVFFSFCMDLCPSPKDIPACRSVFRMGGTGFDRGNSPLMGSSPPHPPHVGQPWYSNIHICTILCEHLNMFLWTVCDNSNMYYIATQEISEYLPCKADQLNMRDCGQKFLCSTHNCHQAWVGHNRNRFQNLAVWSSRNVVLHLKFSFPKLSPGFKPNLNMGSNKLTL